jgi:hypothetical protein
MTDDGMDNLLRERIDGDRKHSNPGTKCSNVTKVMISAARYIMVNELMHRLCERKTSSNEPQGPLLAESKCFKSIKLLALENHSHFDWLIPGYCYPMFRCANQSNVPSATGRRSDDLMTAARTATKVLIEIFSGISVTTYLSK